MQPSFEEAVDAIVRKHPEYAPDAYHFMRSAIDYAADQLNKSDQSPHLSAEELYLGACAHALEEYGPLARYLLDSWNLSSSHDFGCIVYNLIEAGVFGKQADDRQEEFDKLIPLEFLLEAPFLTPGVAPLLEDAEDEAPRPRKSAFGRGRKKGNAKSASSSKGAAAAKAKACRRKAGSADAARLADESGEESDRDNTQPPAPPTA